MQGIVRFFERRRGFGFIHTEAGDFFFHESAVIGDVHRGDPVEFWLDDSPIRAGELVAVEIRML